MRRNQGKLAALEDQAWKHYRWRQVLELRWRWAGGNVWALRAAVVRGWGAEVEAWLDGGGDPAGWAERQAELEADPSEPSRLHEKE